MLETKNGRNTLILKYENHDAATGSKEWLEFPEMQHTYKYQPEVMEEVDEKVAEIVSGFLPDSFAN